MSLLHATWLPAVPAGSFAKGKAPSAGLLIWADTWRVAEPVQPGAEAPLHPLGLDLDELATWLDDNNFWSEDLRQASATLTLPSRQQGAKGTKTSDSAAWSGLPMQAGEPLPKEISWWPWQVEGWLLKPGPAAEWLNLLPLSGFAEAGLADDLRWWAHLQRWCLSLIARGRWLPDAGEGKATWRPLLNREDDRRRLEDLAGQMPQVVAAASTDPHLACGRPRSNRLFVASLVEKLAWPPTTASSSSMRRTASASASPATTCARPWRARWLPPGPAWSCSHRPRAKNSGTCASGCRRKPTRACGCQPPPSGPPAIGAYRWAKWPCPNRASCCLRAWAGP